MMAASLREEFDVDAFVEALRGRGVELYADAGVLRVNAPRGMIDPELARQIASFKPAILEYLLESASRTIAPADQPGISPVPRDGPILLGSVQQRMWLHNQLEPDTVLYNLPAAWRLTGTLDVAAFQRAFAQVVARHEVLRVSITVEDGQPTQRFDGAPGVTVDLEDLSGMPAGEREEALAARLETLRDQPIDLGLGRPFRARLLRMAEHEHVFFLLPHHVVWDGWSFDIFLREFSAAYAAAMEGDPASLPALPIQYADYVIWHRDWLQGAELARQLDYWNRALADPPAPLDLPLDRPRPKRFSYGGDWEEFEISAATINRIERLASKYRATSFMVLLAAWGAFLHRTCGQRDIVVGVPIQARQQPQVANLIGCFVNTVCVRLRIDPQWSFAQLIEAVRSTSLDAFEHQDTPVELLVERFANRGDGSRTPLFQTMFSHQQVSRRPTRLGTLAVSQVHVNPAATPTDLMLAVMEGSAGARGVLHYSSDLFAAASVRRMRARFEHVLDSALADPTTAVHALPVATPGERDVVLKQWNATQRPVAAHATASGLLASTRWQSRAAPALQFGDETIGYAELDVRVNRLARLLRARGARRGVLVGLCVDRSPDMVVALLAIIRTGAAYVPLDPAYPLERLEFMARDARLALLVTRSASSSALRWPPDRSILLDADQALIASQDATALGPDRALDARPQDPAYVIYTSGSTGQPKGVVVPHSALVNFLGSMAVEPGLTAADRLLAVTTLSFDISILELLLPLSQGALVILASREQAVDAVALQRLLESCDATVMQATPVTWRLMIESGWQGRPGLKALVGGETLPAALAAQLVERTGELWNMYGPTETTVWSTCWKVQPTSEAAGQRAIPIGRPIANTRVLVLDEYRQLCPPGVPGEICIGGAGLALEYLRRPELTAQRFISDPFASDPAQRVYRTGDRGRWLANGALEHMGRLDFQVKLRGHRIEPGEIEARLVAAAGAASAVVVVREDRPGDARLVAYVVPGVGRALDEKAVRNALQGGLPAYMIPQHVVVLDALPLTPNGKVDRKALGPPVVKSKSSIRPGQATPCNESEPLLAHLLEEWGALFGTRVAADDDFFDLGGHSLLAVRLFDRLNKATGVNLPLAMLLDASTPRSLARAYAGAGAHEPRGVRWSTGRARQDPASEVEPWAPLVPIRDGDPHAPLFLIHAVGGNVLNYRRLAASMPPGPPIYGLQALGLDGRTPPLTRVEDMAERYIKEIRTLQPVGPYYLAGGSMGGMIAYEMARQLLAGGERVALLALFDTHAKPPARARDARLASRALAWWGGFADRWRGLSVRASARAAAGNLTARRRARARRRDVARLRKTGSELPHALRYEALEASHQQALRRYVSLPYAGKLVLFRANARSGPCGDPCLGWGGLVARVNVIEVTGSHETVVEAPELPRMLNQLLLDDGVVRDCEHGLGSQATQVPDTVAQVSTAP